MTENLPQKPESQPWWQKSVLVFSELSAWIGFPVIGAVFLGRYLDERYNTEPWLFLLTVGSAFIVSMFGIVRRANQLINEIDKEEAKVKKEKDK